MSSSAELAPDLPIAPATSPLAELCDVQGVVGALVVSIEGDLLLEQLPAHFAARARATAPRLAVLLEALSAGRAMQRYCLRFYEQRVHVLTLPGAFLCVLSELGGSSAMLKLSMKLVGRRLT